MVAGQVCLAPVCDGAGAAHVASTVSSIAVVPGEDAPGAILARMDQEPPNDDMLVNLVTYRDQ
jgi:hypothetical protein